MATFFLILQIFDCFKIEVNFDFVLCDYSVQNGIS